MNSNDKELLLKEIDDYVGCESLIEILCSLFDSKKRKKILIDNELGILGSLLDKYKYELDDDVIIRICVHDFSLGEIFDEEQNEFFDRLKSFGLIKDLKYVKREIATDKDYVITRLIQGCIEDENDLATFKKNSSDKDFFLDVIRYTNHGYYLQYASDELKKDKELVEKSLTYDCGGFHAADSSLKNDREYVLELIYKYPNSHIICELDFGSNDSEYLLECVKQMIAGLRLKYKIVYGVSPSTIAYSICMAANAKQLFYLLLEANEIKKNDLQYEFILNVLVACLEILIRREEIDKDNLLDLLRRYLYFNGVIYSFYCNDGPFMLEAIRIDLGASNHIDDKLKNDVNFIFDLISLGIDVTISDDMYKKVNEIYNS